ncbi:MAG: hypothetical protein ACE5JI_10615 [Acidobacteriota bacterium]
MSRRGAVAAVLVGVLCGSALPVAARRPRLAHGQAAASQGKDRPPALEQLSPEVLRRLENWLRGKIAVAERLPTRNIFEYAARPLSHPGPSVSDRGEVAPDPLDGPAIEAVPRLMGFLFPGEPGRSSPVAAIRYQGELWLVTKGDRVGRFRVENLVPGEEVVLVDTEGGEEWHLVLE